jgi:type IV secretory pathway VirB10-like protein
MISNRLAVAALGLACVTAAGGGSYLATRHNVTERAIQPASAASEVPGSDSDAAVPPAPAMASASEVTPPTPAATPLVAPEATPVPTRAAAAPRPTPAPRQARTGTSSRPSGASRPDSTVPALEHTPAAAASAPAPVESPAVARLDDRAAEPVREVEVPAPAFEELTVAADSVIGLQTETTLSSERARIEDRVEARVVRDVRAGGRVAIPAGSRVLGSVVLVERGGKMRDRARLGIRFHTLALSDGTRLPITTETIYRFGEAPGDNSAKKIGGGAVAGAILGAIIGGGKGAAIGATTGAAGGSAVVMAGDRSEAVFQSGAQITARILSPVTVTVDR